MGLKSALASLSSVTNPPDTLVSLVQTVRKVQTASKASKQMINININIATLDFPKVALNPPHIWSLTTWICVKSLSLSFRLSSLGDFLHHTSFNLVVLARIISAPLIPQFPSHPIFPCQPLCECLFPGWQGVGGSSSAAPDGALSGSNEGKTPASPAKYTPSFSAIWHNICRMHIQNQVTVTRTAVGTGTKLQMPGTSGH